jgi:PAS domain S-box-containing protein
MKTSNFGGLIEDGKRLRLVIIIPVLWVIVFVIGREVLLGILGIKNEVTGACLDVAAMALLGVVAFYVLRRVKEYTDVTLPVLGGMIFLFAAQTAYVAHNLGLWHIYLSPQGRGFMRLFVNACNGLGVMLVVSGFLFALIDLLLTTRKLQDEHSRVVAEMEERLRVEAALRQGEAKYRELVQNAHSAIIRVNPRGVIAFFNEFAQGFFGYTEQEILGRNLQETIVPENMEDRVNMALLVQAFSGSTQAPMSAEAKNIRKDKQIVWMAWTYKPLFDQEGNLCEILCIGNDITARKRADEVIRSQQVRMANAARLSSLGAMASGIAHEINSPLSVISIGAEQLNMFSKGEVEMQPVDIQAVTASILRNVERIAKNVRGLRKLGRDGTQDLFAPTPVQEIVAETVELCHARFASNGIRLSFPQVMADLQVECRPSQVAQVLLNLLNNAFDAAGNEDERWVELAVMDLGDKVEFSVTDSGRGIDKSIQERITAPFFTTKAAGNGMGLGLYIARNLVLQHGGQLKLDVDSPHTRFCFTLPKRQPQNMSPATT